jgi:phage terminase small subunit
MSLTPKRESFINKYIKCSNASEAYRHAYNCKNMKAETIWSNASVLLKNNKVAARLIELQAISAKRNAVSVDSLTKELEEARVMATDQEAAQAMIAATMGKAKLHGIGLERKEITGKDGESLMPTGLTVTFVGVDE